MSATSSCCSPSAPRLVLDTDEPHFANWDQDETAIAERLRLAGSGRCGRATRRGWPCHRRGLGGRASRRVGPPRFPQRWGSLHDRDVEPVLHPRRRASSARRARLGGLLGRAAVACRSRAAGDQSLTDSRRSCRHRARHASGHRRRRSEAQGCWCRLGGFSHPRKAIGMLTRRRTLSRRPARVALGVSVCSVLALAASLFTAPTQAATADDPMEFGMFAGSTKRDRSRAWRPRSAGRTRTSGCTARGTTRSPTPTSTGWSRPATACSCRSRRGSRAARTSRTSRSPTPSREARSTTTWCGGRPRSRRYERPIYVAFNHEPDTSNSQRSGPPTQFIAACRKFVDVMRAAERHQRPLRLHHGGAQLLGLAEQPQVRAEVLSRRRVGRRDRGRRLQHVLPNEERRVRQPVAFARQLLDPFMQFVAGHPGPDLVVAEWGSPEDPANPQRKAQWIADAQADVQAARLRAVRRRSRTGTSCRTTTTTATSGSRRAPQSLNAFKAMANDPFYSGAVT